MPVVRRRTTIRNVHVPGRVSTRSARAAMARQVMTVYCVTGPKPLGLNVINRALRPGIDRMCTGIEAYAFEKMVEADKKGFRLVAMSERDRLMGIAVCKLMKNWDDYQLHVGPGERVVYVDAICAQPGVGSVLMRIVESIAVDLGARAVVLQSVLGAVRTYKRWGFQRGAGPIVSEWVRNEALDSFQITRNRADLNDPLERQIVEKLDGKVFRKNNLNGLLVMWKAPKGPRGTTPFATAGKVRNVGNRTFVMDRYLRTKGTWGKEADVLALNFKPRLT